MGKCDVCGETVGMPFECERCGREFCSDHRLPEKHRCGAVMTDYDAESGTVTYDTPNASVQRSRSTASSVIGVLLLPFLLLWWGLSLVLGSVRWLISRPLLLVVVVAIGVGAVVMATGSAGLVADTAGEVGDEVGDVVPESQTPEPTETTSETSEPSSPTEYNRTEVEAHFLTRMNEERDRYGLQPVEQRDALTEMGNDHAANMAEHDYIGHVQPDGTTIEDRYQARGLLPECELPAGDNQYYPGAENAAGSLIGEPVFHPGNETSWNISNEDELAAFLVDSWMTSSGHREVMLLESASEIGLGLAIRDDGEVYATLQFC